MENSGKIYYHGRRTSRHKFYGSTIYITDDYNYAKLYSDGSEIYCFRIPNKVESKLFSILDTKCFDKIKDYIHPFAIHHFYETIANQEELDWSHLDYIGSDNNDDDLSSEELLESIGFTGIYLKERESIESILIFKQNSIEFIGMKNI